MRYAHLSKSRRSARVPAAFTLIELVGVLALAAIMSGVASLMLSGTARAASFRDASDRLIAADATMRDAGRRFGRRDALVLDPATGTIARGDSNGGESSVLAQMPSGVHIELVRIGGHAPEAALSRLDFSTAGRSQSYAVLLVGTSGQRQWLTFAGLTGHVNFVDEQQVDQILGPATTPPRVDAN